MGPCDELLQAAAVLGFKSPPAADNNTNPPSSNKQQQHHLDGLAQAKQLVEQCQQLHDLELRLFDASAHLASRTVTDQQQLAARAAGLNSVASMLQLICASKDAIADQLRSANLRPHVPVAPQYQQDFADMLRCAASNAAALQDGLQALQWAAGLSDKPSCWEDQLRIIRDSAQSIKDCLAAIQEFDQQLTRSSGVGSGSGGVGSGSGGVGG